MCVVVHDIEPVYSCARKDHEIRERNGHAGCPATIGELNRPVPDLGGDLVVGKSMTAASVRTNDMFVNWHANVSCEDFVDQPPELLAATTRRLLPRRRTCASFSRLPRLLVTRGTAPHGGTHVDTE